jgi:hypothetical protein
MLRSLIQKLLSFTTSAQFLPAPSNFQAPRSLHKKFVITVAWRELLQSVCPLQDLNGSVFHLSLHVARTKVSNSIKLQADLKSFHSPNDAAHCLIYRGLVLLRYVTLSS